MSIVAGLTQLTVEEELHEVVEVNLVVVVDAVTVNRVAVVVGKRTPLTHFGSAVLVAQTAESGVGTQPVNVIADELLVFLALEYRSLLLGINLAHEVHLALRNLLVVNILQSIELLAKCHIMFLTSSLAELAHIAEAEIERMESESGVGVIGV